MSAPHAMELTPEEMALIDQHYEFYRALDTGERRPETAAQRHFVAVCQAREKAVTDHERAYVKYRILRAAKRRQERPESEARVAEFGEGVPAPGWFSDEGWKRMRGQYLTNSD